MWFILKVERIPIVHIANQETKIPGVEGGVDAVLAPSAHPICHHKEILPGDDGILSALVLLLWMRNHLVTKIEDKLLGSLFISLLGDHALLL